MAAGKNSRLASLACRSDHVTVQGSQFLETGDLGTEGLTLAF